MKEIDSAAYQLFHTPWACAVPEIYCRSRVIVEELGTMVTGIKELDDNLLEGNRERYLTIAGMVTLHEEGSPIYLMQPGDSVEIYRILMQHLKDWEYIVTTMIYIDTPPAEDFILLDEFASVVHPLATYYSGGERPTNSFNKSLRMIQGKHGAFLRDSFRDSRFAISNETKQVKENLHDNISSRIAKKLWSY